MCVYAHVFTTLYYIMYIFELLIRSTKYNNYDLIITILKTWNLAVGM